MPQRRRPVLPVRRQRRPRRPRLLAPARVRPRGTTARGHGDAADHGDAGSQPLRPRPARLPARHRHVDGVPAAAVGRDGQELVITPATEIPGGTEFSVVVPYAGTPQTVIDPDGSSEGWVYTADGAVVVNEPQGSPGWYPANDTPRDKATYTISMTVPDGLTAVGNGALLSQVSAGGRTTFVWRERFPMAPYLTTITLGRFNVTDGPDRKRHPDLRGRRPALASSASNTMRKLPAHGALPRGSVRRLPVRDGRRHRRRRARARLLAGVADQARVRLRAGRADAPARALAHVVRRRGDAVGVARHLAPRGLRDVRRSGSGPNARAARPPPSSSSSSPTRPPSSPGSGTRLPAIPATPPTCSTARSTTAAA